MKQRLEKFNKFLPIVFVLILGLTPLIWFFRRPGVLIDGSDTNFPLNPTIWFVRRFYVWNATVNAGSDFSPSTSGIFFHLVQVIPYLVGLSLQNVQIVSVIFWFTMVIVSAYILARTIFPQKFLAQLLFVVFYSFNTYLFNTWENIKVSNLALVAGIPLVLSIFILCCKKIISFHQTVFYSLLTGIVIAGCGINPSYFITLFVVFFVFAFIWILTNLSREKPFLSLKSFGLVSLLLILVNLYWILPSTNFIFRNISSSESLDKIGYTNWIDSLSQNTSLLNVVRLQGAWDWYAVDSVTGLPLYIPYSLNYFHKLPFIIFGFLIPTFVIASLIFVVKKRADIHLAFAIIFVIGVFLGAGTHPPTGFIYGWLNQHLPFFSLFRSPWYVFTPMVILSQAGLIGLFFYNLTERLDQKKWGLASVVLSLSALTIIVGNFVYTYPLVTGKIFRPSLPDNFLIRFPPYVFEAKEWLSKDESVKKGRIVGYPSDEIERFTWGYNGIDSILGLLSDVEVLSPSLNAPEAPISRVLREFYSNVGKKEVEAASGIASKLNIIKIFEKKDQNSLSPSLPDEILGLKNKEIGKWAFYDFPGGNSKIQLATNIFFGSPYQDASPLMEILDQKSVLVNPKDSVVSKIPGILEKAGRVVLAENSQVKELNRLRNSPYSLSDHLEDRDLSKVDFIFETFPGGKYTPILERYRLEDVGLPTSGSLNLTVDGKKVNWTIIKSDDSYIYFSPAIFPEGTHKLSLALNNENLVSGGDFRGGGGYIPKGNAKFEILEGEDGNHFLSILNKSGKDASAVFDVASFDPLSFYFIKIRYKQIYGGNASTLVNQSKPNLLVKSDAQPMPNYPEWGTFSYYFEPVRTKSNLNIELVSEGIKDALGTKVYYDDLVVNKVFQNRLILLKEAKDLGPFPKISFEKISPVEYRGIVEGADGPHTIIFSENYSPEWEIEIKGLKPKHFSANLFANAWYIGNAPSVYKFKIYYAPQRLFDIGMGLSLATLLGGTGLFIFGLFRKK